MKILVAEDDRVTSRLLQSHLSNWGHEVVTSRDGEEAWRILNEPDSPNLAILDWMMPKKSGVEICRALRKICPDRYVYVILLTSRRDREDVVEGLEAGADDYIVKPFDPHELRVRIRAAIRMIELQENLRAALLSSEYRASHDHLTGLFNRSAILDVLKRELARASRQLSWVGVIIADLDHFKQVNDRYGHQAGDRVLEEVARRLSLSVRQYDSVGRYGGEEFLIVLPGCDIATATGTAERIRLAMERSPIVTSESSIPVTMSLGVNASNAGKTELEAVIRGADKALYVAKDAGRNRVEVWTNAAPVASEELEKSEGASEHAGGGIKLIA